MRQLGKRFAIVVLVGIVGIALVLVGGAVAEASLALAGLALALLAVIGAQVSQGLELRRLRRAGWGRNGPRSAVPDRKPELDEHVREYRNVSDAIERITTEVVADLRAQVDAKVEVVTAEVAALLQLMQGTTDFQIMRADESFLPTQVLEAVEFLKHRTARRILTLGMGRSNYWLAENLMKSSERLVAVFDRAHENTESDMLRLREQVEAVGAAHKVTITSLPSEVPDIVGAYRPWLDLTGIDEGERFDAIVVAVASEAERRAVLPVLELLRSHLVAVGCVLLMDRDPENHVARAWAAVEGWRSLAVSRLTTGFIRET